MISFIEDVFREGERFRGYTVEKRLGKGGLGAVYLVRHEMLDALFALKVLFPQVAVKNPSYVKRFLREAKISTRIRHQNLVSVHDCGFDRDKDVYYLVMDFVNGSNLREALALSGKFSCEDAAKIVAQVASALDAAQRYSIVHRDIKPENIMLQKDGVIKLVDLGIAKAVGMGDSLHTTVDGVFGTPAYVSPEQALSASDVDLRADVYSLGIVFFEMVCGRCPYVGKNAPSVLLKVMSDEPVPDVRQFNSEVPEGIALLIGRMCEKVREKRIGSPGEVIGELVKLGYVDGAVCAPAAEYSESEDSSVLLENGGGGIQDVLQKESVNTLSFDTKDTEIQKFVLRLKWHRLLKRALAVLLPLAVLFLVWTVLTW